MRLSGATVREVVAPLWPLNVGRHRPVVSSHQRRTPRFAAGQGMARPSRSSGGQQLGGRADTVSHAVAIPEVGRRLAERIGRG